MHKSNILKEFLYWQKKLENVQLFIGQEPNKIELELVNKKFNLCIRILEFYNVKYYHYKTKKQR